ncbi:MAG: hypothetical protein WCK78_18500 [Paludibacter sp.]
MQKNKTEQEKAYLEIKYLYSQLEDDVPQDIRDQIKRNLEKAHKGLYVILPAYDDLEITLKEHMLSTYPEFKDNSIPHLGELVSQVCDQLAYSIVNNVNSFLIDLENNNTPYIENEEQFRDLVTFFATPLEEPEDSKIQSPEEMKIAESTRAINNDKKEFLNSILKVLFRYFEESLNKLDAKGWQLLGISLGHSFFEYMKHCYVLMAGLTESIVTDHPGISFKDLEKRVSQDLAVSSEHS